jgi:membrane-associated protease RseP (regulator of RpoE activity)
MRGKSIGGTAASHLTAASVFVALLSFERAMYPVLLATVVLLHELGHIVMAYFVGAKVRSAGGGLFRLCLYYDPSRVSYRREALICAGGVIANFIMAAVAIPLLPDPRAEFFFISNVASAVFNLLPLRVLDGGGILRCYLLARGDADKADCAARRISLLFTVLLFLLSVYVQLALNGSFSLFALSVYLIADTVLGA